MNATIETKKHIEESIRDFRNMLLQDINKGKYETDMFMNELKSMTYLRLL